MAYHKKNITRLKMHGNRLMSLPDARATYCQPPTVAIYRGSAISVDAKQCRKTILLLWRGVASPKKTAKSWKDIKHQQVVGPVAVVPRQQEPMSDHDKRDICHQ